MSPLDVLVVAVLRPQTWREYEAVTIDRVVPALTAAGVHVVGLWYTIIGDLDEAVSLVRYRDLAQWAEVGAAAVKGRPLGDALDQRAGLTHCEHSTLLAPSTLAHGVILDLEGRTVFANRIQHLVPGAWEEYEQITANEMWPRLIPRGGEPVGLWRALTGDADRAVLLTQYKDLAAWEGTHPAPGSVPDDRADEARQRRKRLFRGEQVRLMRASRYRP